MLCQNLAVAEPVLQCNCETLVCQTCFQLPGDALRLPGLHQHNDMFCTAALIRIIRCADSICLFEAVRVDQPRALFAQSLQALNPCSQHNHMVSGPGQTRCKESCKCAGTNNENIPAHWLIAFCRACHSLSSISPECSAVGKRPVSTSSRYSLKARCISAWKFAYFLTNLGVKRSNKPSKSCVTSTCPSHLTPPRMQLSVRS